MNDTKPIRIEAASHRKAKIHCAVTGMSLTELASRAVDQYVDQQRAADRIEQIMSGSGEAT